jgi:hypothetical protein
MRVNMRAIFAVSLAFALIFGLFVSSVLYGARGSAFGQAAQGLSFSCHSWAVSATQSAKGAPARSDGHSGAAGCPDCCLAAHAGAAVLPGRFATVTRPMRVAASRVRYFALATHEMEAAVSNAVNGARAPPARFRFS